MCLNPETVCWPHPHMHLSRPWWPRTAQRTEGAHFSLTDTRTCVITAHRACAWGWMTGRNGACGSGPLLSEGLAPHPPHPWLECIFLRLFIHGFIPHKHLSHFVGVGSGGAVSHRGPRLDSVRAGGAEPGSDSGKDRGLPRGQRGLRRRPGCPWLPAPALRSHLGPGHESSLNTPLHYCCVPGRWMWASGA